MSNGTFRVVTKDSIGGQRIWIIQDADDREDARAVAAKSAALDHIADYEDFGSDSAYLNALDQAARRITIVEAVAAPGLTGGRPVANRAWLVTDEHPAVTA